MKTTTPDERLRAELRQFLAGPPETETPPPWAIAALALAAEDSSMAELLRSHEQHAERLLEAAASSEAVATSAVTDDGDDELASRQAGYLVVGTAAIGRLDDSVRRKLDVTVADSAYRHSLLSALPSRPTNARLRACLATMEVVRLLEALIESELNEKRQIGLTARTVYMPTARGLEEVPREYFVPRVAEFADVDEEVASVLLDAIFATALEASDAPDLATLHREPGLLVLGPVEPSDVADSAGLPAQPGQDDLAIGYGLHRLLSVASGAAPPLRARDAGPGAREDD